MRTQEQHNFFDDFILGFRKKFTCYVVEGFEKKQGFFGKVLEDDIFRNQLKGYLGEHMYQIYKESGFEGAN